MFIIWHLLSFWIMKVSYYRCKWFSTIFYPILPRHMIYWICLYMDSWLNYRIQYEWRRRSCLSLSLDETMIENTVTFKANLLCRAWWVYTSSTKRSLCQLIVCKCQFETMHIILLSCNAIILHVKIREIFKVFQFDWNISIHLKMNMKFMCECTIFCMVCHSHAEFFGNNSCSIVYDRLLLYYRWFQVDVISRFCLKYVSIATGHWYLS
jgi:hypothetical protein